MDMQSQRTSLPAMNGRASRRVQSTSTACQNTACIPLSIVSNSGLLREGLVTLLAPYIEIELVSSLHGQPVDQPPPPNPPGHVVLLDGSLAHGDATAWTARFRGLQPRPCVIVMELTNDVTVILGCIEAGASAYTLEGASPREVARTIEDARRGRVHCSPEVAAELFARVADAPAATAEDRYLGAPLTPREFDVLHCIARGCSNKEIAAELVIELRTVKHHVHNILRKLDLSHRWDAARLAQARGWLEEAPRM